MIKAIKILNKIGRFTWDNVGQLNLIIGGNEDVRNDVLININKFITGDSVMFFADKNRFIYKNKKNNKTIAYSYRLIEMLSSPKETSFIFDSFVKNIKEEKTQYFITTCSQLVLKKVSMLAEETGIKTSLLQYYDDTGWKQDSFDNGMPNNQLIDESIRLYEYEISRVLG